MRFLSPLALVGLALIALPIAIHLLVRRRAQRLDFPSLKFLRDTHSFRLRPRHIQQPLLLTLRVAAIACLVLGLSRPLISFNARTPRMHVILLDASLSMQARGRTEAAREQARSLINGLAAGERAAVIAFSTDSVLLSAMTFDKRKLSDATDRYQPTSGAANYAAGLMAADALLHSEPAGETWIDLVSDFQSSGLAPEHLTGLAYGLLQRAQIKTHPIGAKLERNAFLVDEQVTAGESGDEIDASEIVATADERSGIRKSWMIDSREGERIDVKWRTESNGQVTARIRTVTPDDFDADDERFLAFASPRKGRALLIEREGDDAVPYLRAALDATAADLGDKRFTVERKASLPGSASELSSYSLVTLTLHGRPRADELRVMSDYARAGGTVWLCISNDVNTAEWDQFANTEEGRAFPFAAIERRSDPHAASGFGSADADAPALRFMSNQALTAMRAVRMHDGFAVTPRVEAATIMRWNDGTVAFVSADVGSGRVLLLATSPARAAGDLGISATFPALASSIAQLSVSHKEPIAREVGQPVNLGLVPSAPVKIVDAKGKETTGPARDLIMHPAAYFPGSGIFRVETDGFTTNLAINGPAAESESALASDADIERAFKPQAGVPETQTTLWQDSTERDRGRWRYFLFAALMLLILEMWIAMRQRGRARMRDEG